MKTNVIKAEVYSTARPLTRTMYCNRLQKSAAGLTPAYAVDSDLIMTLRLLFLLGEPGALRLFSILGRSEDRPSSSSTRRGGSSRLPNDLGGNRVFLFGNMSEGAVGVDRDTAERLRRSDMLLVATASSPLWSFVSRADGLIPNVQNVRNQCHGHHWDQ